MLSTKQFKKDTFSALNNHQLRSNFKSAMSGLMQKRLAVFPDENEFPQLSQEICKFKQEYPSMMPELIDYKDPIEENKDILFEIDAAITPLRGGIAETGSLIIWPTSDEPRMISLVTPIHIAVLHACEI